MKNSIKIAVVIFISAVLLFLTLGLLDGFNKVADSESIGWLSVTPFGPSASVLGMILLLGMLFIDMMWIVFVVLYFINRKQRTLDRQNDIVELP